MRRLSLDMVDRRRLSEHPVTSNFLEFLIFLFSLGNNKKLANKLDKLNISIIFAWYLKFQIAEM